MAKGARCIQTAMAALGHPRMEFSGRSAPIVLKKSGIAQIKLIADKPACAAVLHGWRKFPQGRQALGRLPAPRRPAEPSVQGLTDTYPLGAV
jgi:hypothetical protein